MRLLSPVWQFASIGLVALSLAFASLLVSPVAQGSPLALASPAVPGTIQNPILAGFKPDPSIVRVGPDYYLESACRNMAHP